MHCQLQCATVLTEDTGNYIVTVKQIKVIYTHTEKMFLETSLQTRHS